VEVKAGACLLCIIRDTPYPIPEAAAADGRRALAFTLGMFVGMNPALAPKVARNACASHKDLVVLSEQVVEEMFSGLARTP
jgi:hypothetical protein